MTVEEHRRLLVGAELLTGHSDEREPQGVGLAASGGRVFIRSQDEAWAMHIGARARLGGMTLTTPKPLFLAVAVLAAVLPLPAQQSNLKGNYDTKSGLITPALESGIDVQVVTTDSVPGKQCEALAGSEGYFPVMVLPTSGSLGGRTLADGAIRGMKTLREAAIEAGANAVLGLRSSPYVTRNGNPRMFLYGTLAVCE